MRHLFAVFGIASIAIGSTAAPAASQAVDAPLAPPTAFQSELLGHIYGRFGEAMPAGARVVEVAVDRDYISEFLVTPDPSTCGGPCRLRFLSLAGDAYRDLFSDGARPALNASDSIQLELDRRNGSFSLRIGPTLYVWDGNRYVDSATIARTELSTDAFMAGCTQSGFLAWETSLSERQRANAVADICACMANGFETRGLSQQDIDRAGEYISHGREDSYVSLGDHLTADYHNAFELEVQCHASLGWGPSFAPPAVTTTPATGLDLVPFLAACPAFDWVPSAEGVATADRAVAFCGCMAHQLNIGPYGSAFVQADIDALKALYAGEIQEGDLDATRLAALDAADQMTEQCLSSLPPRP